MAEIANIEITSIDDYDLLKSEIPTTYIDDCVVKMLKCNVGTICKRIVIDYPYYDRDFLSTYYIFYAKKFRDYSKKCYRLILIGDDMKVDNGDIGQKLIGYITLRPTHKGSKIGKSYIDPEYLLDKPSHIMLEKFKMHFDGTEVTIDAFPWMQQESDVSICAHTALWSVIRYARKFRQYPVLSMAEVIDKVECDTRKIPSVGLTVQQISNVLLKCGFSPIVRKEKDKDRWQFSKGSSLLNECLTYVDSGIPVIGTMDRLNHAIVLNGYCDVNRAMLDLDYIFQNGCVVRHLADGTQEKTNVILHTELINSLIANDDGFFPYKEVSRPAVGGLYRYQGGIPEEAEDKNYYLTESINNAVIPLYSRTQLAYNDVLSYFIGIVQKNQIKDIRLNWPSKIVARIFMTSANSYKEYIKSTMEDLNEELCSMIMEVKFPRFIWCVEISSFESYKDKKIDGIAIIDPTCSTKCEYPFIFLHDGEKAGVYNVETAETPFVDIRIAPYCATPLS